MPLIKKFGSNDQLAAKLDPEIHTGRKKCV